RSRRATDLDDVDAELGEQRGVAVREPDLHLVAGVAIRDRGHRRCAPHAGRIEGDAPAGDVGLAAPADAEADSGGVLAYRCRVLARQQHPDGDFDAGCQPQAGLLRPRVRDQRATPAVARWGDAGQPVDLGLDRLPGDDQRLPPRNRHRGGTGAIDQIGPEQFGHDRASSWAARRDSRRGWAFSGWGSCRPALAASAEARTRAPIATSARPMPIGRNNVRSAPGGRPTSWATTEDSGRIASQASGRSRQCSMSSDANRRAWSMLSVTIRSHRSTTPASSSARSGVMAPTALMWEPGSTMSVCRMGAVARVTSVMTRAPATASATDGAATTGTRSSSLTCAANA